MNKELNVLLTSVGRRSYMVSFFQEALKDIGKVHAGNSEFTYAMEIADKAILTPLIHEKNYISFLINYCIKNNINVIVPLFDIDLSVLAKNKQKFFKKNIKVIVSSYKVTQICNDKWLAYNFLVKNKFNAPKTFIDIKEVERKIKNKQIFFPLIIKPRWGMGSIAIFQANNMEEVSVLYKKTKEDILNTYLKYESRADCQKNVIIQEKIIGQEYGLDVVNDLNGNYIGTFPKKKLAMRAGETDCAVSMKNNGLIDLGKKIGVALKHIGNLDVDCFVVKKKKYVLEMNCRFGGGYPFSHLAGVNVPKIIISNVLGEKDFKKNIHFKYGVKGYKNITPVICKKNNEKKDKR